MEFLLISSNQISDILEQGEKDKKKQSPVTRWNNWG